jgi:hypothetical protein
MKERVWIRRYAFSGPFGASEPVAHGCVCDDYHRPHYHLDGEIKRNPDRIIERDDPEWKNEDYRMEDYKEYESKKI